MTETLKYNPGTIVMFEEGEYSDFGIVGGFVTLCELDLRAAIEEFKGQFKPNRTYENPEPDTFCAWLVMTGKAAPLEYQTVHIGSYGRLEL